MTSKEQREYQRQYWLKRREQPGVLEEKRARQSIRRKLPEVIAKKNEAQRTPEYRASRRIKLQQKKRSGLLSAL